MSCFREVEQEEWKRLFPLIIRKLALMVLKMEADKIEGSTSTTAASGAAKALEGW